MELFHRKCPRCNAVLRRDAVFCSNCRTRLPESKRNCPHCAAENEGAGNFCIKCGKPLDAPTGEGAVWKRGEDDLVTRISITAANLYACRNLLIEHGTKALLFAEGRFVQELGPGSYDIGPEPPPDTLARKAWELLRGVLAQIGIVDGKPVRQVTATALLVDEGDISVKFSVSGATRDPINVMVDVELVMAVSDASALFVNLMKGRAGYTISDLRGQFFEELQNAMSESLAGRSAFELSSDLELKNQIAEELRRPLAQSLARYGLVLKQVRTFNYRHPVLDEQQKIKEELLLQATEQEARNAGRKRLFDALDEAEIQELAEQTRRTENREKKLQIIQRLRRLVLSDRMDELRIEMEKSRAELAADEEMKELARAFTERREDHELDRRRMLERLDLEHELAMKAVEIARRGELSQKALDAQLAFERAKRLHELQDKREREQAEAESRFKTAQTDAEVEKTKLGTVREKMEITKDLRKTKIALDDEEERNRIAREQDARDREARRDLERIKALSDVEQTRLAGQLRMTEALKGLSEEQVLIHMSKGSPEVAAALVEYYKSKGQAGMNAETKELYQKILDVKDSESGRMERMMNKFMESAERMAGAGAAREKEHSQAVQDAMTNAMDRNAEVATARAGARARGGESDVVCPECHRQVEAGSKFCDNCGHQFFE